VNQFRPENTEVLVLHVLQPVEPVAPPEMAQGYAPELEDQKEPAHALVEQIAEKLLRVRFQVHTAVEIGDVRVSILNTAAEWHADLIAVGSQGQRSIESFLLGSVAGSVARHAKCSVEIVRTSVGN
jgi:nucleotide-binding universal stress UspA family protein